MKLTDVEGREDIERRYNCGLGSLVCSPWHKERCCVWKNGICLLKVTGYSCARHAKCIGSVMLNFSSQKSLVRRV